MQRSTLLVVSVLAGYALAAIAIALLLRSLAAIRWQAGHDELTGLMCRGAASRHVAERQRGRRPTTVVMLDLDHFKAVNDNFGHRAGDQLLAAIGARLARESRRLDGRAARLGGDEFLLMLPAMELSEHTRQVQDILCALNAPVSALGHRGPVALRPSATAGIATALDSDWNRLLCAADYALHRAKRLGTPLACYDTSRAETVHSGLLVPG